jgi:hypothetical protein
VLGALAAAGPARAQDGEPPAYLADRGTGISTSLFGTYVRQGELLVYAFYEYTKNTFEEYKPSELGFAGEQEFAGTSVEEEHLLFLAYGATDRLAVELEGSLYTTASLDKDPDDTTAVPERIEESGLGEIEGQIRYRWRPETARRPELYSFLEVVFPVQTDEVLIGVQDWEFGAGFGAIRGFRWGTITGRLSVKHDAEDAAVEPGEYAFEYLKRVSPRWRLVGTLEGEDDEVAAIGEAQWFFRHGFLKLNCGFGLTEKAPDIAPEVGVIFSFGAGKAAP